MGDNIDNIKGVRGIGPVNAKKLIQQFSTVENIYQEISNLPDNTREMLEKDKELVYCNKKIIVLKADIPLSAEKDKECNFC